VGFVFLWPDIADKIRICDLATMGKGRFFDEKDGACAGDAFVRRAIETKAME
jgi:hypothetical protein